MIINSTDLIKQGFIEAMYFFLGTDADMKDEDGRYLDGEFNECLDLTNQSIKNIEDLVTWFCKNLSEEQTVELFDNVTLDKVGHNLFLDAYGLGEGFYDESDLSDELKAYLYQLLYNSFFFEVWDDEINVHLSYSSNITTGMK